MQRKMQRPILLASSVSTLGFFLLFLLPLLSLAFTPEHGYGNPHFLLNVPDNFFGITFFGSGILLQITKSFGRLRMEERAWEQRLEEGRRRRLEQDPTLTELDLRRREAAMEWSAYGKPRMDEDAEAERRRRQQELDERSGNNNGSRKRVKVMDQQQQNDDDDEEMAAFRQNRMTDQEIDRFEMEFGIDYDPYYDDPYTEDELPEGNYRLVKAYGDRIYDNGEIFYKDAKSNLFYRQGAKPRSVSFFG